MSFFSKLFSNPNNAEKFCSQEAIDYYFYRDNGTWYGRRPLCFRPYFSVDENNNLIEIASDNDGNKSVPLYFGFLSNRRTQYSDIIEKEMLIRKPKSDVFEFWKQKGYETPFVLSRESLLERLTNYIPYSIFTNHHGVTSFIEEARLVSKKDGEGNIVFYTDRESKDIEELDENNSEKLLWHKKSPIPSFRPEGSNVNWKQKNFKHNSLYSSLKGEDGKPQKRYLWVFDFETTGLDPDFDEILEIGLCIYLINPRDFGCPIKEYSCLRKVKVPDSVENLTGISQSDVNENGIEDETIISDLLELYNNYGENAIFASYNLYFDASFFLNFLKKYKQKLSFDWLDILTVARDRFDYPHKLGEIIKRIIDDKKSDSEYSVYDLSLLKKSSNSHRALDDAKAACNLLLVMMHSFDDIAKYIGIIGHPLKYPLEHNQGLSGYLAHPHKGRERGKILSRVQFYKMEYPIYFTEKRDVELNNKYYKETLNEITASYYICDCALDIDYKLVFEK